MNKKELKANYEAKTLGEVRGVYSERLRVLENMKALVKDYATKIANLDTEARYYVGRLKDYADNIKSYSKDIAEEEAFLAVVKPILDKKEAEGLNQEAYEKYMADNKDNIKLLILKVKEMETEALTNWEAGEGWKEWTEKDIKRVHDTTLKELVFMLKDSVGDITEVRRLEYNPNRGMDGVVVGSKGTVAINTILAGGYNIQCLHYRTLISRY